MSRIEATDPAALPPELAAIGEYARSHMGFLPNDMLVMAKWPELLKALSGVVATAFVPGEISMEFKELVGLVASGASGCRYCAAHAAYGAHRAGGASSRLDAAWDFESSPAFTPAERIALRVAATAGARPGEVSDADLAALRAAYSERQVLEIVAVIALFGFLNRWNGILGTRLEAEPLRFASARLAAHGWRPGRHADGDAPA